MIITVKETLEDLAYLGKIKDQLIQELAEKFVQGAIEHEEDIALAELSIKRNTPGAETVDYEDVKWKQSITKLNF